MKLIKFKFQYPLGTTLVQSHSQEFAVIKFAVFNHNRSRRLPLSTVTTLPYYFSERHWSVLRHSGGSGWGEVGFGTFNLDLAMGNSLEVQWLGLCAFIVEGLGSIPEWGTKIQQVAWCSKKKKQNENKARQTKPTKLKKSNLDLAKYFYVVCNHFYVQLTYCQLSQCRNSFLERSLCKLLMNVDNAKF